MLSGCGHGRGAAIRGHSGAGAGRRRRTRRRHRIHFLLQILLQEETALVYVRQLVTASLCVNFVHANRGPSY